MCVDGLLPIEDEGETEGAHFLTFVVPAHGDCNLRCGFCFVRQRYKYTENAIQPQHYSTFIHEVRDLAPIYALAIQGHEPLLPTSWPYTRTILETGAALDLRVNLVTNGTYLLESSGWLSAFAPANIAISLDAASADEHDRLRGVSGAWAAAIRGIERATEILAPRTNLAVASVLMPKGCAALEGMPRLLRQLGIERWIITPLLKVGRDKAGGPVGDKQRLYRSLSRLQDAADDAGIRMTVDDELDCLEHERACQANPRLRRFHVRTIPAGVELIRLEPGGECVVGKDILRTITDATPRWQPGRMRAADFLKGLTHKAAREGALLTPAMLRQSTTKLQPSRPTAS